MGFLIPTEVYLDNNATTQPLPLVRDEMIKMLGAEFGNPSSSHSTGDRARNHLRRSREIVSQLIGADPSQIVFTSGGTESNNLILSSVITNGKVRTSRLVTTQVEHSSILKFCEYLSEWGVDVVYLPVNHAGLVSIDELEAAIVPISTMVSVQWVNNETGVIQPIEIIGEICRRHAVSLHTDAAQAVGKLKINVSSMPIDFLSLTGHKFHAPQGTGAIYATSWQRLRPMFYGGSQENGLRPGTENIPGIVGLGKAAELRKDNLGDIQKKLGALRDRFENLVLEMVPGVEINGDRENRVCNTTNLLFRDIDGQALVAQLDQVGIRCSQSSACTNQRPEPSYVLRAMGLSEDEAYSSVRFSFSELNTFEEVEWATGKIAEICTKLREFGNKLRMIA